MLDVQVSWQLLKAVKLKMVKLLKTVKNLKCTNTPVPVNLEIY